MPPLYRQKYRTKTKQISLFLSTNCASWHSKWFVKVLCEVQVWRWWVWKTTRLFLRWSLPSRPPSATERQPRTPPRSPGLWSLRTRSFASTRASSSDFDAFASERRWPTPASDASARGSSPTTGWAPLPVAKIRIRTQMKSFLKPKKAQPCLNPLKRKKAWCDWIS